jgi:hypothetical protein
METKLVALSKYRLKRTIHREGSFVSLRCLFLYSVLNCQWTFLGIVGKFAFSVDHRNATIDAMSVPFDHTDTYVFHLP